MPPVELEIFMRDLTKAGLASVGKNLDSAEDQARLLISALEQVRAEYERTLQANRQAGKSYKEELANVQALTGQINGLKEGLKELEAAKKQTGSTPLVDTDAVARKTGNLRLQFQQVARELPSLAMGPQMFILAVSNNLPMLADAIADVRRQNELLKASGQKSVPVWKQLAGSLFSWQTGLVAAISLGIVFGKDIVEWTKKLFSASKAVDALSEAQQRHNELLMEESKEAQIDINRLRMLYNAATDAAESTETRRRAIDELKKQYPSYFGSLDREAVMLGKAADAYERLTTSMVASSRARAYMKAMDENSAKILELEQKITAEYTKRDQAEATLEKRIRERDSIDRNTDPDGYAGAQMLVGSASGKVKAIDDKIAGWRNELYQLQKVNRELEAGIDVDALLGDAGGTGVKTGKGEDTKKDYATELAEARLRAEQTTERLRIQIMREGMEKRRALAQQEYKEAIADIDKQEQDTLATMDAARKQGDVIPDSQYEQVRQNADRQRILQQQVLNQKLEAIDRDYRERSIEAEIAYNKQYGTYAEQRSALITEGLRKAAAEETEAGKKLILRQTQENVRRLDFSQFKDSINFADVFGQLDTQSTEALTTLRDKLRDYINGAAKELGPEDLKELQDAFKDIDMELMVRQPFKEMAGRAGELAAANRELERTKELLDAVRRGEKTYLTAEEALEAYNKAKERASRAGKNYARAEETAREQVERLSQRLQELGGTIGGQAGEIISLIGQVGSFASATVDGITQVAKTGADAISAVEKASVILGIISTAIQLLQRIGELGSNRAFGQYEEFAEKVNEINALTDAVNQYSMAVAEANAKERDWFSEDNLRSLRDFKALQEEVYKAYMDKAMESQAIYQNESGGGWLTGAFNWIMGNMSILGGWDKWRDIWGQGDYAEGMTAAINNLRIETRKKSSGFLGTGIGGHSQETADLAIWAREQGLGELFDEQVLINSELAQAIIDNYGDKLVGQTQETLEALMELRKQYDQYIEELHEYVSSLYEPLVDNFVDSLWDWFDTGKDALDSFKEYASDTFRDIVSDMLRTIVLENVVGTFGDDIAALYEKYASGQINERDLMQLVADRTQALIGDYQSNLPALQGLLTQVDSMLQGAGIDLSGSATGGGVSQSPESGALTTMSQDSISTFEGIGRSLQTHVISMDETVKQLKESRQADSEALSQIAENTSHLLPIREILEKIDRDGIKVQ